MSICHTVHLNKPFFSKFLNLSSYKFVFKINNYKIPIVDLWPCYEDVKICIVIVLGVGMLIFEDINFKSPVLCVELDDMVLTV